MNILIIDDDHDLAAMLTRALQTWKHLPMHAPSGADALKRLELVKPEAILLDVNLPDVLGLELLPLLREKCPSASVLVITGEASPRDAVTAMKLGAENYLEKPFELDELKTLLETMEEKRKRKSEAAKPAPASGGTHGRHLLLESAAMQSLYARAREVAAQVQVNVLIAGDTGTGKEHLARLVHAWSPRAGGPFVELHCAALPETLLESELFGFEPGAFTGATHAKPGLFEQAQGGTVFLDEIGEIPLAIQAKLLKVLEEKRLRRLGSVREIALDARLVAASNRDLKSEVKAGRFRQDLYYRLNVVSLDLPALKGRDEDIEALARHYHAAFLKDFGKPHAELDKAVLDRLKAHAWPGNVRELRNAMERLALQGGPADLSFLGELQVQDEAEGGAHTDRESLRQALEVHHWNRSKVAEALGISRPTLLKWMKRHELM